MKSLKKRLRLIQGGAQPRRTSRTTAYERGLREGRALGKADGRKELREELTFTLGIAKGETLIGGEPKQFYIRVAVDARAPRRVAVGDELSHMSYQEFASARHITFRAVKHGWSSGNGDRFIWFNWELER